MRVLRSIFGLDRMQAQAIRLRHAIAAALADFFVDDQAQRRLRQFARATRSRRFSAAHC